MNATYFRPRASQPPSQQGIVPLLTDAARDFFAPVVVWPYWAFSRRFHALTYLGCFFGFVLLAYGIGSAHGSLSSTAQWVLIIGAAFLCTGATRMMERETNTREILKQHFEQQLNLVDSMLAYLAMELVYETSSDGTTSSEHADIARMYLRLSQVNKRESLLFKALSIKDRECMATYQKICDAQDRLEMLLQTLDKDIDSGVLASADDDNDDVLKDVNNLVRKHHQLRTSNSLKLVA